MKISIRCIYLFQFIVIYAQLAQNRMMLQAGLSKKQIISKTQTTSLNEPVKEGQSQKPARFALLELQISQVIAKNEPIDIHCEEDRPFDNFFIQLNSLGYQFEEVNTPTIMLEQHLQEDNKPYLQQDRGRDQSSLNSFSNQINTQKIQKVIKRKIEDIMRDVSKLGLQRNEISVCLHQMKSNLQQQFNDYSERWRQLILTANECIINFSKSLVKQFQDKQYYNESIQLCQLKQKIAELQAQISQLNSHASHLQLLNQELKYQISKLHYCEQEITTYKQQIHTLTQEIQRNVEYIFDIEQKLANSNFEIQQVKRQIKRQYEIKLQQEFFNLQQKYIVEFTKIQQEIKNKIVMQFQQEYKAQILQTVTNQYKQQIQQLKKQVQRQSLLLQRQSIQHRSSIHFLQQQKMKLIKQNTEYLSKIKSNQYQLQQLGIKLKLYLKDSKLVQQLSNKLAQLQFKFMDTQIQLNYYKQSQPLRQRHQPHHQKKSQTILILDQTFTKPSSIQSAISPSSSSKQHAQSQYDQPQQETINNILNRIKMKHEPSVNLSFQSNIRRKTTPSYAGQSFRGSGVLWKQKDIRMKSITSKLQQLRADIRKQIGSINV